MKCPGCDNVTRRRRNDNTPVRRALEVSPNESMMSCDFEQEQGPRETSTTNAASQSGALNAQCNRCLTREELLDIVRGEMRESIRMTIEACLNSSLKEIQTRLDSFEDSLSFMTAKFDQMEKDLNINDLKKLKQDNDIMQGSIKELQHRLNLHEQAAREANVEISGLPEFKGENLINVVMQLGKVVSQPLEENEIQACFRVAPQNRDSERPRTVIAKLKDVRCRDSLLAATAKFNRSNPENKLNSSLLGIAGKKCDIYVSEHLTPTNKSLHAATRIKAKELKYKFVWVRNGRIYVRKEEKSQHIIIKDIECVNKLT